jgi:hypothetical protein
MADAERQVAEPEPMLLYDKQSKPVPSTLTLTAVGLFDGTDVAEVESSPVAVGAGSIVKILVADVPDPFESVKVTG